MTFQTAYSSGFLSWQVAATATTTATSATNVTITGISQTVDCPGLTAVYLVDLDLDWSVGGGITAIAELLIDGSAQSIQMVYVPASTDRSCQHKRWRITGLAAGSHTFAARHRASGPNSTVNPTHSVMTIERAA